MPIINSTPVCQFIHILGVLRAEHTTYSVFFGFINVLESKWHVFLLIKIFLNNQLKPRPKSEPFDKKMDKWDGTVSAGSPLTPAAEVQRLVV